MLHWIVPLLITVPADSVPAVSAREMWAACQAVRDSSRRYAPEDSVVRQFCIAPETQRWSRAEVPSPGAVRRLAGTGRPRPAMSNHLATMTALAGQAARASSRFESLARDTALYRQVIFTLDSTARRLLEEGEDIDAGTQQAVAALRSALRTPGDTAALRRVLDRADSTLAVNTYMPSPPPPFGALASPGSAGLTPIGMQSRMLWSVSDAVVSRSREQLNSFLLLRVVRSVCGPPPRELTPYLVESCRTLAPEALEEAPLNIPLLRAALARDMETLPGEVVIQQVRRHGRTLTPAQTAQAYALVSVVQLYRDVTGGVNPRVALLRLREHARTLPEWKQAAATSPLAANSYQLSAYLGTMVDSSASSIVTWNGVADSAKYPMLAMAVNARHDPHWPVIDDPTERATPRFDLRQVTALVARGQAAVRQLERAQRHYGAATVALAGIAGADSGAAQAHLIGAADSVIVSIIGLLEAVGAGADPGLQRMARTTARLAVSARLRNYSLLWSDLAELARLDGSTGQVLRFSPQSQRVLTFATAALQAESGEEMDAAVSQFMAAGDSYLRKRSRTRELMVSLNAYGGGQTGVEMVGGNASAFAAPYLPVGIEIGFARPRNGLLAPLNHVNLFVQLVDLGALASWRFSHGDTEQQPNATAAQVFAPGAYLVFPIRDWPLSVGAGWSWSPQLRRIDEETATPGTTLGNAQRVPGVFVAFDVPLFP